MCSPITCSCYIYVSVVHEKRNEFGDIHTYVYIFIYIYVVWVWVWVWVGVGVVALMQLVLCIHGGDGVCILHSPALFLLVPHSAASMSLK